MIMQLFSGLTVDLYPLDATKSQSLFHDRILARRSSLMDYYLYQHVSVVNFQ